MSKTASLKVVNIKDAPRRNRKESHSEAFNRLWSSVNLLCVGLSILMVSKMQERDFFRHEQGQVVRLKEKLIDISEAIDLMEKAL